MNETISLLNQPKELISWLKQRLKFKYHDDLSSETLHHLSSNYEFLPKKIPISLVEKICRKHYPDFDLDNTPDMNVGYSDKERLQIKNLVIDIISDTINFANQND